MKRTFSLLLFLAAVLAGPPNASAQFKTETQLANIAKQVQEIANRIQQYTALTHQFTQLDCAAQGMAAGAETTPAIGAPVICDTLNMLGALQDSYPQLLERPTNLLHTPVPLRNWRDVLQQADTVSAADIGNIYQSDPYAAAAAIATYQRQRDYADRRVVLAHGESDAAAALTDTLDEAEATLAELEAHNAVTATGLAQTQVTARLSRAQLIVALSQLRAYQASAAAAAAYDTELLRREIVARRLAGRAALEARWAQERAVLATAEAQRIESMYGGFRLHPVFSGN